jgi:Protein of unknown function (DUF1499)
VTVSVTIAAVLLAALLAVAVWVRLAPSDPSVWHISPTVDTPWDRVSGGPTSASLRLSAAKGTPEALLARLDALAMATPRTTRLAGSVAEGRITWITRSALWGFPDYTTAEVRADGLYILARLRFGGADLGVNAARLNDWLSRL